MARLRTTMANDDHEDAAATESEAVGEAVDVVLLHHESLHVSRIIAEQCIDRSTSTAV